ncbi:hypothetical protein BDN70DRAFT_883714 [Pholiota conissans]|uniref:Uncharacterized protein n=1 Tax=Pholiota conissans TaxID=109636 RepID=A0A9P6CXC5_9AGAR|nr:hypothetical protein BDN70DRAFT_883714 [Pholiota conissans]
MSIQGHPNALPHGIWERIAFYTVASAETFLGPPSDICSVVLISRSIYQQVSYKTNTNLFARIFRFKFDYSVLGRRFSERWRTSGCLASELIKRFRALKRIKAMELRIEDLWTAYLMMMENDGRNDSQLQDYADFTKYLQSFLIYRSRPEARELAWFRNPVVDSLVIWILWLTSSEESIRGEDPQLRQYILDILHVFITAGHLNPSFYAPDIFFTLPMCSRMKLSSLEGLQITPSVITHYSHELRVHPPVITPAAIMALVVRAQSTQTTLNIPPHRHDIPSTRTEAIFQGYNGPTMSDILHFHLRNRISVVAKCTLTLDIQHADNLDEGFDTYENEPGGAGSLQHDIDWTRIVACYDPRIGDMPLRGVVYKLGSMVGSWEGRLLQWDQRAPFQTGLANANPTHISVRHRPLYWQIKEHHCMSPNDPVSIGADSDAFDDILNAWFPRGVTIIHEENAVRVLDPLTGKISRYETVIPRNAAEHCKEEKLTERWISWESHEAIAENPISMLDSTNPDINLAPIPCIDDDDEYNDTVSHLSSGVMDILLTGTTGDFHGDAWGHYTIYGRVRPWDGLVALLRFPTNPDDAHLGKWIFRGYLHNQNFVGKWRETSTPIGLIGYEGGYAVHKTD